MLVNSGIQAGFIEMHRTAFITKSDLVKIPGERLRDLGRECHELERPLKALSTSLHLSKTKIIINIGQKSGMK